MATATAPKPIGQQIVQQVREGMAQFGGRLEKTEKAVDGLMKLLEAPASKAGVSPAELVAKMTDGGRKGWVVGGDGTPITGQERWYGGKGSEARGRYWQACAYLKSEKVPAAEKQKAYNLLAGAGVEWMHEKGGEIIKAALAESAGVTGGYTIPPQFSDQLLMLAIEDVLVRPRASKMTMTALTLQVPSLDHTTSQGAGNTPFLGGVIPGWVAEAQTRAESEPQFRQTELKAHELSLYAVSSNTLLADNVVGLDNLLTMLFGKAIGWYTDYAYLQGNGVGKPLGILNAPAAIAVNRLNVGQFQFADAAVMFSRLYGVTSWRNPASFWAMHPSVFAQLVQMRDAAGRVIFLPVSAGVQDMPAASSGAYSVGYLFGVPVLVTEKLPKLGTAGDVILVDASKYLLGDRQELQVDVSPHVNFLKNQTVWRVVWRGDGQPWLNNAVTLADGTFTVSPFVTLN